MKRELILTVRQLDDGSYQKTLLTYNDTGASQAVEQSLSETQANAIFCTIVDAYFNDE